MEKRLIQKPISDEDMWGDDTVKSKHICIGCPEFDVSKFECQTDVENCQKFKEAFGFGNE